MTEGAGPVPDRALRRLTGYSLKRAYNRLQTDAARVLDGFGLRITTYSALSVICATPDLRQSQLAEALSMERSNTVVIVDTLEQADLIERRRVPHDRRSYALRATKAGRRLFTDATAALERHEDEMLGALDAGEREELMRLLHKIDETGANGVRG
ncbi:MarR family winged helix-turn-helix transcriptional regulator [Oceanicola sp. 22II-s10i]|uniref:MarR family winged helix-turn-helix transcriptional regulator n=1 Tax=Oceanicola sp. 22II-s10i TaxID=1317116 RepID=UPI001C3DE5DE|nr:MarR family winged helix-turn-helix transcriptional regulator [Oceanicola sp. 22II-s10i]